MTRSEDTTPAHVLMARDAAAAMSDAQKVAFAIEIAAGITDERCTFHLDRLSNVSRETATILRRNDALAGAK